MGLTYSRGPNRIFFDRIFQRSYWTWRKHPAIIVPTMLGAGLSAIGQSIITISAMLVLTSFAIDNKLFSFLDSLFNQGALQTIQSQAYSLPLIPTIILAGTVLIIALVLGGGFILSAEYGTYLEASQTGKASFRSLLENGAKRWRKMAWTILISNLITWSPLIIGLVLTIASLPAPGTITGIGALIGALYLLLFALGASLLLSIFTLYSYAAVVVDEVSGLEAVRHSFNVASRNLGVTMTYGIVNGLFQLVSILILLFAGLIGLPLSSLASTILSLLLTPVLHSTKTMIYYHAGPDVPEMAFTLEDPIANDVLRRLPRDAWRKVKLGLSESARYISSAGNVPFHTLSLIAFVIGIFWGGFVSDHGIRQYVTSLPGFEPGRLNPLFASVIPPALGVDIFLHNWLVSIAASMSGIGFAFPSFETILFNGFIVGIVAPLVPTFTMLLAVIAPHGIIEIPAFLLAGSVGIKLGYAAIRTRTQPGPLDMTYLSEALRQAVYIVIGLAPLFFIAGLIEADLTPVIARMFGWT